MNIRILLSFLIAIPFTLLNQIFIPGLNLFTLSPFIASLLLYSQKPTAVFLSTLAGLYLDFFSSNHFGIYALSYGLTSFILFSYRRIFDEKFLGFALYTSLISFVLTILEPINFFLFQKPFIISGKWVIFDLCLMPLLDGLYAIFCFSFPFFLFDFVKKRLTKTFFSRRGY